MDLFDSIIQATEKTHGGPPGRPNGQQRTPQQQHQQRTPHSQQSQQRTPPGQQHQQPQRTPQLSSTQSFGRIPKKTSYRPDESEMEVKKIKMDTNTKDTFQTCKTMNVRSNMYEIDIAKMPDIACFSIQIEISNHLGMSRDLNQDKSGTGDLSILNKRYGIWNVFQTMMKIHGQQLFGTNEPSAVAYDCGGTIFAPVGKYRGKEKETFRLTEADFKSDVWNYVKKMARLNITQIDITVKPNIIIYTKGSNMLRTDNQSGLIRALEVITSQRVNTPDYYTFGNATFSTRIHGKVCRSDATKEVRDGFEKTMKIVEGPNQQPIVAMVLDVRRSPFYCQSDIITFLGKLGGEKSFGGRDQRYGNDRRDHGYGNDRRDQNRYGDDRRDQNRYGDDRRDQRDVNEADLERFLKTKGKKADYFKGLAVVPTYLDESKQTAFYISGIEYTSARDKIFDLRDGDSVRKISVYDYYIEKYGIRLRYPDLPLATQRKGTSTMHYPLEVLTILPGQRVKQNNQGSSSQSEMTSAMSFKPDEYIRTIESVIDRDLKLNRSSNNRHIDAFNISFKMNNNGQLQSFAFPARVIPPPIVKFDRDSVQVEIGKPQFGNKRTQYVKPAKLKNILIIGMTARDGQRMMDDVKQFARQFSDHCRDRQIRVETDSRNWSILQCAENDSELLEKMFKQAKEHSNVEIIVCVTETDKPDCHDVIKFYESHYGIQTLQISRKTAQAMTRREGGTQTINNVMRKFNVKCGGVNFKWDIPEKCQSNTVCSRPYELMKKFVDKTIHIGFEIAHGSAVSLFDRQNKRANEIENANPSVVGVSYSLKDPCELGGFNYLQDANQYSLTKLDKYFPMILDSYYKSAKELPQKILIYRVGTSDAEFKEIDKEVLQMKDVLKNMDLKKYNHRGPYNPAFVVISAIKNSHVRIFKEYIPNSKRPIDQNVESGTVIDSMITTYGIDEFILISQTAMIGTVRPIRYTILKNEANWTKNEIYHLTYWSAFGHQVSYQPPAIPAVLYAAENMAKRGRNNLKAHKYLGRVSDKSNNSENELKTQIDKLSDELNKVMIDGRQFWA